VCQACWNSYRDHMGEDPPPLDEFREMLAARAEVEADEAFLRAGSLLSPQGSWVLKVGIQATVQALGFTLQENRMTICAGWVFLLGAEAAVEKGILDGWEQHDHPEPRGGDDDGTST
jgi:hypothetical protein